MIIDRNNLELLIQALDSWVNDSVLPAFPKSRISRRKTNNWNTTHLCMTKEWKMRYRANAEKALCELIINHFSYIYIREYPIIELVNNYKYLYDWLINKVSKEDPLL